MHDVVLFVSDTGLHLTCYHLLLVAGAVAKQARFDGVSCLPGHLLAAGKLRRNLGGE